MISRTSPQLAANGNIVPIGNRNTIVAAALFDRPARIQRTVTRMNRVVS